MDDKLINPRLRKNKRVARKTKACEIITHSFCHTFSSESNGIIDGQFERHKLQIGIDHIASRKLHGNFHYFGFIYLGSKQAKQIFIIYSWLWKYHARLVRPGPISFRTNENFNLLVLGQVQMYKINKKSYFIF